MITYTLLVCSWALWAYWPDTGNIQICSSLPEEKQVSVLYHELGHKFWFESMAQKERDEWAELRNSMLFYYLFWHEEPSVEEDFAYAIEEMYYDKKCTYPDICKLTRKIIKNHK